MNEAKHDIDDLASKARHWWLDLQPDRSSGKGDRAALAKLRRATPVDAMAQEATLALFKKLGYAREDERHLPRVATLACILAHVRSDDRALPFARAIGRESLENADSARLKPLRFQRLITADSEEEIAQSFRRALAIIGKNVSVADLARIILFFEHGSTKQRLTFDYFGAGKAALNDATAN